MITPAEMAGRPGVLRGTGPMIPVHPAVVAITRPIGSGKTTTVTLLARQLVFDTKPIPFAVREPTGGLARLRSAALAASQAGQLPRV